MGFAEICHEHADCANTYGSFECSCKAGYEGDGIGECIKDVDDCVTGDENKSCLNTMGSYECLCKAGFINVNGRCVPVDDCVQGVYGGDSKCPQNAACTQVDNGFTCQCHSGYVMTGDKCVDINECQHADKCGDNKHGRAK